MNCGYGIDEVLINDWSAVVGKKQLRAFTSRNIVSLKMQIERRGTSEDKNFIFFLFSFSYFKKWWFLRGLCKQCYTLLWVEKRVGTSDDREMIECTTLCIAIEKKYINCIRSQYFHTIYIFLYFWIELSMLYRAGNYLAKDLDFYDPPFILESSINFLNFHLQRVPQTKTSIYIPSSWNL